MKTTIKNFRRLTAIITIFIVTACIVYSQETIHNVVVNLVAKATDGYIYGETRYTTLDEFDKQAKSIDIQLPDYYNLSILKSNLEYGFFDAYSDITVQYYWRRQIVDNKGREIFNIWFVIDELPAQHVISYDPDMNAITVSTVGIDTPLDL